MIQHVVIRREDYVTGTSDRPEPVVFTQTHASRPPVPWGRIKYGEQVWMKWSGGPIVAKGVVEGFRQIENCTPEQLRETVQGTGLYNHDKYWNTRPPIFFGMTIYIKDARWLDTLIHPIARSHGGSWVVIDAAEKEKAWLSNYQDEKEGLEVVKRPRRSRGLPKSIRFEVFRRDNFTCTYCGRKAPEVKLQIDHYVPWSKGGSNDPANLRTACRECNIGKSDRVI